MDGRQLENEIKISIPMLPDMELAVSRLASALAETINLENDKIDEIKMAIIEACLNAFEHSRSKDQMVHVLFRVKPSEFEIIVKDYGIGFDPSQVDEPDLSTKMHGGTKRGWGLKIMKSLMDDVKIFSGQNGTKIVMTKNRD